MTRAGYSYVAMTKYLQNNLAKGGVVPAHCFRVQFMVSWPCEAEHSIIVERTGEDSCSLEDRKQSKEAYRK